MNRHSLECSCTYCEIQRLIESIENLQKRIIEMIEVDSLDEENQENYRCPECGGLAAGHMKDCINSGKLVYKGKVY